MERITLDSFEICGLLGEGGFGKVLIVEHKQNSMVLALKFMRKEALICAGTHAVEQALRERSVLVRLSLHPHPFVVMLHYAFQDTTNVYLAFDYVGGGDLFFLLRGMGRMPLAWSTFVGAEVCLALEHVHNHGIVFRDLKPENILVGMDGHMKLTDFGLAKCLTSVELSSSGVPEWREERATSICGTPSYMAPETVGSESYDFGVDWWAFGCLMYEMLTGSPAFPDTDLSIMVQRIMHARYDERPLEGIDHGLSLVRNLLTTDRSSRLGGQHDGSTCSVRAHAFFEYLDFEKLVRKALPPPFKPSELADGMAPLSPGLAEGTAHLSRAGLRQVQARRDAMQSLDDGFVDWCANPTAASSSQISSRHDSTPALRRSWSVDAAALEQDEVALCTSAVTVGKSEVQPACEKPDSIWDRKTSPTSSREPSGHGGAVFSRERPTRSSPFGSREASGHGGAVFSRERPTRSSPFGSREASGHGGAVFSRERPDSYVDNMWSWFTAEPPSSNSPDSQSPCMQRLYSVGERPTSNGPSVSEAEARMETVVPNLVKLGTTGTSRTVSKQAPFGSKRQSRNACNLGSVPSELPVAWSADSVATPLDMQRELAPALRRWCERFLILYGRVPTREAVRGQLDAIIYDVIPNVSPEEAERLAAQHHDLHNSV